MARLTIYRSDDAGAPVMSGQTGTLITLLQACLIDGYTASVTSINRSGSVATVVVPVAHHLYTGQSVTIAGANEGDYNGTFVVTVVNATTFTYVVGGSPASPATGTITWKKLGAGWTKPYTGTNKAAFQQGSGSNSNLIRIDDSGPGAGGAKEARITGYETMSDVDTGTHPYPTAAQGVGGIAMVVVRKSTTADATARPWIVAADSRTFYCFINAETSYFAAWGFGEIYSLLNGDTFRQFIQARNSENNGSSSTESFDQISGSLGVQTALFIDRGHNGTGDPVNIGKHGDRAKCGNSTNIGAGLLPYTNPANGAFYMGRIWFHDPTTTPVKSLRGRQRGFWQFMHAASSIAHLEDMIGTGELAGKTFLMIKPAAAAGANTGCFAIETSDTVETN